MSAAAAEPMKPGLSAAELESILAGRFGLARDQRNLAGNGWICPAARLREVVRALRDDTALRFTTLLDVVGIDYLAYPGHRGPRFAVVYVLRSLVFRHRVSLKVEVEEDAPTVPSLHDLYRSADWAEREVWDQYGIVFAGHPNPGKRLLNHHEFQGHPLRKDYPCQKRQKLSINDTMVDQLEARLKQRGYTVIERDMSHVGIPLTRRAGGQP